MGRKSRHRKIKSCDPFYKGSRLEEVSTKNSKSKSKAKESEENMNDEQKIPYGMRVLLARAKALKMKKTKPEKKPPDPGNKQKSPSLKEKLKRKPGEGKKEYFNRIDHEAAMAVAETMKKDRKMSDRRKNHLKARKEKMKQKKQSSYHTFGNFKDFNNLKDERRFGDVVQEPPSLTAKPRKATLETKGTKGLLLNKLITNQTEDGDKSGTSKTNNNFTNADLPKGKKRKLMSAAEKQVMDKERERVIMAYRMTKKNKIS